MFWPFILNQTMNRECMILLQWYILLTEQTWTPCLLWKMLYHTPQGSSTPGKPAVPQIPVKTANGKPAQSQSLRAARPSLVYLWRNIWPT